MLAAVGTGLDEVRHRAAARARSRRIRLLPARARSALFLVLKAFASGASALTGVEAIANGVNAFSTRSRRTPRGRSASSP